MRILNTLFILFTLLLLLSFSALAQEEGEATEETPAIAGETTEDGVLIVPDGAEATQHQLETIARSLFTLLWNAAYIPFAAPLVTVLTAVSKRLPLSVSGAAWAFSWTIVLWIAYVAATHVGYANQFETAITTFATLGAMVLGITITPVAAGSLYQYAAKNSVALLGYSKTPSSTSTVAAAINNALNKVLADALKPPLTPQRVAVTETVEVPRD